MEILFIMGFTIHNIEEAIWLPEWSRHAVKFHREVNGKEFRFALVVITAVGYLLTFQYLAYPESSGISRYAYLGFVAMMVLNTVFPHMAAYIALRKYAPGLVTGVLLNFPLGLIILIDNIHEGVGLPGLAVATVLVTITVLLLIKLLFRVGRTIFS